MRNETIRRRSERSLSRGWPKPVVIATTRTPGTTERTPFDEQLSSLRPVGCREHRGPFDQCAAAGVVRRQGQRLLRGLMGGHRPTRGGFCFAQERQHFGRRETAALRLLATSERRRRVGPIARRSSLRRRTVAPALRRGRRCRTRFDSSPAPDADRPACGTSRRKAVACRDGADRNAGRAVHRRAPVDPGLLVA